MNTDRLLAIIGALLTAIGMYTATCLKDLTTSVQDLSVKMATVITIAANHESRITHLEEQRKGR